MATNFIQRGENLTIPAPAIVTNGEPVFAGSIRGIALHSAPMGMPVDVATGGVWELAKVAADDVSLGDAIYWDASASLATTTATDNVELGVAVAAAGTGMGTVSVRLASF